MQKLLDSIRQHKLFVIFIFLFAYAQSIQIRIWVRNEVTIFTFTPEAAIITLLSSCVLFYIIHFFIKRGQRNNQFTTKNIIKIFSFSLLLYLLTLKTLGFITAVIFDTVARNFNKETILLSLFSDLMNGLIYGSFFIAYYYFQKNNAHQQQLASYNQALSESKISQLKHQLNPHFLFNNLNILDQLIEEDKEVASQFLNEFADIYRYVLNASDIKTIALEEEIKFAEKYFGLIEHKYGEAYQLKVNCSAPKGYIVPLTLQLLIENALQHNLGTKIKPVIITISMDAKLVVTNTFNPKKKAKTISGRALNNLKEQYAIVADLPVEIKQMEKLFSVIIPLISNPTL